MKVQNYKNFVEVQSDHNPTKPPHTHTHTEVASTAPFIVDGASVSEHSSLSRMPTNS